MSDHQPWYSRAWDVPFTNACLLSNYVAAPLPSQGFPKHIPSHSLGSVFKGTALDTKALNVQCILSLEQLRFVCFFKKDRHIWGNDLHLFTIKVLN